MPWGLGRTLSRRLSQSSKRYPPLFDEHGDFHQRQTWDEHVVGKFWAPL